MKKAQRARDSWTKAMRWTARLVAVIAASLFVLFVFEVGISALAALSWSRPQGMPLLAAVLVALLGALLAWRWELVGGSMTLVGAAAIIGLVCLGSGTDMFLCSLIFSTPLLVAGALYLGCCRRTRQIAVALER